MLKNKSFWVVKPPSQCSWYWRKLLKLRDTVKPLLKHNIGNGCGTFLWYDNWHPLGPLIGTLGHRVVYDSALPLDSKVSSIIHNETWCWPLTNTLELMEIRNHMASLPLPSSNNDTIQWIPSPNGRFSTPYTWDFLRNTSPVVPWYDLVWFPGHCPRHSVIVWFAILHRLSTHDRIFRFTPGPLACVLCHQGMETPDHLFFHCTYSSFVWQGIRQRLDMRIPLTSWDAFIAWASGSWKTKTSRHFISKICLGSAIYSIWCERNARSFNNTLKTKDRVLSEICNLKVNQIHIRFRNDPALPQLIAP